MVLSTYRPEAESRVAGCGRDTRCAGGTCTHVYMFATYILNVFRLLTKPNDKFAAIIQCTYHKTRM